MSLLEPDSRVVWLRYNPALGLCLWALRWGFFYGRPTCWELVSTFDPCGHQTIRPLCQCGQGFILVAILLEFFTSFAAFSADRASIYFFRSVDRRYETKIMQNNLLMLSRSIRHSSSIQALANDGRDIVIFLQWWSVFGLDLTDSGMYDSDSICRPRHVRQNRLDFCSH